MNNKGKVKAYVLMNLKMGTSQSIIKELQKIRSVVRVASTTGLFDMIVRVEVKEIEALEEAINEIHAIEGIIKTETEVVIKEVNLEDD